MRSHQLNAILLLQRLTVNCCVQIYDLYGVLVHQGHSMHSGHYYCFVKAPNGVWNKMDDSTVGQARSRFVCIRTARHRSTAAMITSA